MDVSLYNNEDRAIYYFWLFVMEKYILMMKLTIDITLYIIKKLLNYIKKMGEYPYEIFN